MANIRVKDLPNTNSAADTDEFIIDSSTAGTRRLSYSELKSEISTDFQGDVNTYKIATLASDNKLDPSQIPDTLSQGLNFVGVANSSSDLTSTTQGDFYVIQTAFDSYQVGDQAVYNGSSYTRVTDGTKQITEGGTGATTLDAAKVNLEIIDVGTAPNEVPLNGQLGSMAYQSSEAVSVDKLEVTDKVDGSLGVGVTPPSLHKLMVQPTDGVNFSVSNNGSALRLNAVNNNATSNCAAEFTASSYNFIGGSVGIGTATPGDLSAAANNLVVGSGAGNQGLSVFAGTTGEAAIYFADGTAGNQAYRGYVVYQNASDSLVFGSSGATRWTINSSGNLVANSTGIDFGSGASTTLDDYETGTAEVAFGSGGGSVTISSTRKTIFYTKIGRQVHINGELTVDSVSSPTGELTITGLPFASSSSTGNRCAISLHASLLSASTRLSGFVEQNQSYINIRLTGATGHGQTSATVIQAGSSLIIGGTYTATA